VKRFRHNRYGWSISIAAMIGALAGCPKVKPTATPTEKSAVAKQKTSPVGRPQLVYVSTNPTWTTTPRLTHVSPSTTVAGLPPGMVYAPPSTTLPGLPPGMVYAPPSTTTPGLPPGIVYAPPSTTTPGVVLPPGVIYAPPSTTTPTSLPPGVLIYTPPPPGPSGPRVVVSDSPPATVPPTVANPPETVGGPPDEPPVWKLAPVKIDLPSPAFRGTPKPQDEPNVEKPLGKPRPDFLAPQGTVNLARGKKVAGSDPAPSSGEYDLVTDDDKEATDFGYVKLRTGTQWIQIDLEQRATIYAVLIWHNHAEARVYRDVIVQVSDEPDFLHAKTVFNNDYDNSSGLGIGEQMGYVETSEGKLIDCRGVEGRYVRCYSKGNTHDEENHYTEVAVYGRPAR